MLACRGLYLLLAVLTVGFVSVGVLAIDEYTRIANRTIERVSLSFTFLRGFRILGGGISSLCKIGALWACRLK